MKKLLVTMFLAFGIATPLAVADTGSAVVSTDAGWGSAATSPPADTGSAVATAPAAGSDAASKLHDPVKDLKGTIKDLEAAKKTGWSVLVFAILVVLARLLGMAKSVPWLAWLGKGRTAIIVGGVGAIATAGYNALLSGGSGYAVLAAVIFTGATYWNSHAEWAPPPAPSKG